MAESIIKNNAYKIRCFQHWVSSDIQTDGSTTIPFSTFTNQISDFHTLIGVFVNLGVMAASNKVDLSVERNGQSGVTNRDFIRLVARSTADVQKGWINVLIIYA